MMYDLGRCPIAIDWVKLALGFYNRIIKRDNNDVFLAAMRESCHMASNGVESCWAAHVNTIMERCGVGSVKLNAVARTKVHVDSVVEAVGKKWWTGCMHRRYTHTRDKM